MSNRTLVPEQVTFSKQHKTWQRLKIFQWNFHSEMEMFCYLYIYQKSSCHQFQTQIHCCHVDWTDSFCTNASSHWYLLYWLSNYFLKLLRECTQFDVKYQVKMLWLKHLSVSTASSMDLQVYVHPFSTLSLYVKLLCDQFHMEKEVLPETKKYVMSS